MTYLSPQVQALKDAVKTLYRDDKCAEMGWEIDKSTIIVVLRAIVEQLMYVDDDGDMCINPEHILDIAEELEKI
jgi:hypothetical protein